jgi:hypothetical protein
MRVVLQVNHIDSQDSVNTVDYFADSYGWRMDYRRIR